MDYLHDGGCYRLLTLWGMSWTTYMMGDIMDYLHDGGCHGLLT